jgi:membrane-associated phospholipid phosphatase
LFTRGRGLGLAVTVALTTGGLAVLGALLLGLPLRDPDGFLGPSWLRLPAILGLFIVADIVPRTLIRARGLTNLRPALRHVIAHRWPWERLVVVLVALASFYVTYVGYRNLKSFLPMVRAQSEDLALMYSDDVLAFGHHPGDLLHEVLGTGVSAHVLSFVYISFLLFVPISLAAALVWSRNVTLGLWYTTALCLNWSLGTASYYMIPASGPFAEFRWRFYDLPETGVSALQSGMLRARSNVLADPLSTMSVSSIAAFASLHTSIVFTAALIVHLAGFPKVVRWTMWVFFVLTVVSTIYFGWHYIVDDVAGLVIGGLSVWLGWLGTRKASDSLSRTQAQVSTEQLVPH